MNINLAREEFLNRFPSQYREHLIDFTQKISNLDCEVIVLTARKAACFFHCLEYLCLWNAGQKIVVSDRLADHDLKWIAGKKVAIVDEVIITGTTLYKLVNQIREAKARDVRVYALFVSKDWFVEDFFDKRSIVQTFIRLDASEAQALGTSIVEAMHSLPRPYSIDYPMSGWNVLSIDDIQSILVDSEWETTELPSVASRSEISSPLFFRSEPKSSIKEEIDRALGFSVFENSLIKIRMYGRRSATADGGDRYEFRIVPYVVLEAVSENELTRLFGELIAPLSLASRRVVESSCRTGTSRLRLFQYVLAGRLAREWCRNIYQRRIITNFVHDSRELSLIFPVEIHDAVIELSNLNLTESSCVNVNFFTPFYRSHVLELNDRRLNEVVDLAASRQRDGLAKAGVIDFDIYELLIHPFYRLYREKEIPLREQARKLGKEIFNSGIHHPLLKRLEEGITYLDMVRQLACVPLLDVHFAVSSFIDIAVDQGLIVPITVESICSKSGCVYYSRAYRHGEETYIVGRDLALFRRMLTKVQSEVVKSSMSLNIPTLPPTFQQGLIPKLILEKILVLFLRYCIHTNVFSQVFSGATHKREGTRLSIARDLHGVRVAYGNHRPTQTNQDYVFVKYLKDHSVIDPSGIHGYRIVASELDDVPDKARQRAADRFGLSVARAITALLKDTQNADGLVHSLHSENPSKRLNRTFTILTTCENSASTLIAVGAEFRRACENYRSYSIGEKTEPAELLKIVENYRFSGHTLGALNSAYMKIRAYALDEAEKRAGEVLGLLSEIDESYAIDWGEIWDSSRKLSGGDEEKTENEQILYSLDLILSSIFSLLYFERWVLLANEEFLSPALHKRIKANKKAIESKFEDLASTIDSLSEKEIELKSSKTKGKGFRYQEKLVLDFQGRYKGFLTTEKSRFAAMADITGKSWFTSNLKRMNKAFVQSEQMYEWIDQAYENRGRLASMEHFDSVLSFSFDVDCHDPAKLLGDISALVARASHMASQGPNPRGYAQSSRQGPAGKAYLYYLPPADKYNKKSKQLFVYARGASGARWLGYLTGNLLRICSDLPSKKVVSALGLEGARRIVRNIETGVVLNNQSICDVIESLELEIQLNSSVIALLGDGDKSDPLRKAYVEELSGVLKSGTPVQGAVERKLMTRLGGDFMVSLFRQSNQVFRVASKIGFINIVHDEGATFSDLLKNNGISVNERLVSNKLVREFSLSYGDKSLACTAIQSSGQGNVDVTVALSNLIDLYPNVSFSAIYVVGICCNFSNTSRLRDVILPIQVLDTQLEVQRTSGITKRSNARDFRKDVCELINGFFVSRVREGRLVSRLGELDGKVRSGIIVSDNSLLRDGRRSEAHREISRQYNDAAFAYDMESAGVVRWLQLHESAPPTFVVKGLSDQGSLRKKDDENRYRAATNASCVALELAIFVAEIQANSDSALN